MSKQRVSIKNYSHHHHVLLRNRRLMLHGTSKARIGKGKLIGSLITPYILGDNDDIE